MMKRGEKFSQELRKRLSKNLVRLRAAQGLSLVGLADRADLHLRHLQKIEAGEVNVTLDTVALLARGLGVDSYDLLAEAPRGHFRSKNAQGKSDSKRRTASTVFKDLQQRLAHHLARFRAKRGLTLEQLAERSGIPVGELANIERGKGDIELPRIAALVNALSVDPEELVAQRRGGSDCDELTRDRSQHRSREPEDDRPAKRRRA